MGGVRPSRIQARLPIMPAVACRPCAVDNERRSVLPPLSPPGSRLLTEPPVRLDGLFEADQTIAVRVDVPEVFLGAEPLAAGDVAVAVDVHLAEPERARGLGHCGRVRPILVDAEEPGSSGHPGAERHLKLPRYFFPGQEAVLVRVPDSH